jgi:hypothetical protein
VLRGRWGERVLERLLPRSRGPVGVGDLSRDGLLVATRRLPLRRSRGSGERERRGDRSRGEMDRRGEGASADRDGLRDGLREYDADRAMASCELEDESWTEPVEAVLKMKPAVCGWRLPFAQWRWREPRAQRKWLPAVQ